MNHIDPSSLTSGFANIDPWRTAILIAGVLVAQGALYLILGRATRRARARAREAARAWAETQRAVWRARTDVRAERARARESDEARAERAARRASAARAALVAVVAIAATNLSAHGIQAGLPGVGLGDLNTRVSAFVVFEGLLALSAALSWWHQTTNQPGYDRYRAAMWAITAVMSYLGWAWSGSAVFALWPPLAAVAWHWVVTAEARRRHGGLGLLGRWRAATAERLARRFRPADDADRRRRLARIERRAVRANTAPRLVRAWWSRAFDRAHDAAKVRGYLDEATLTEIATGVAARYAGARALAPEAVADLNPWARLAAPARTVDNTPAPVEDAPTAPEPSAPSARRGELRAVPAPTAPGAEVEDVRALIDAALTGPADAVERGRVVAWLADYRKANDAWPTGRALAEAFDVHQGTGRKWLASVKDAA